MVQYAKSVDQGYADTDAAMKAETDAYNLAHKTWVEGMMKLKQHEGTPIYPDANSTLRLTYGKVGSYSPKDGMEYNYYTTLKGVMEKEDPNNYEFVVPAKLKDLYNKKDFGRYAMKMVKCHLVLLQEQTIQEVIPAPPFSITKGN